MLELFWASDVVTLAIFFGAAFVLLAGLVSYGVVRFARRHVTPASIVTFPGCAGGIFITAIVLPDGRILEITPPVRID